jgi:hypothetical protein
MGSPTMLATRRRTSRTSHEELAQVWHTRPGWGLAANLTPPELAASYRLRALRGRILLAVCLVALLCAAGFAYGFWRSHQAGNALAAEQSQASVLAAQGAKYGAVTRIQGEVSSVNAQLSKLLADDVDVSALLGRIEAARPNGVAITSLTVSLDGTGTPDGSSGGSGSGSGTGGSLDTSGAKHIGAIQIAGTGRHIDDLPAFVDKLAALPGVVDVLPASNTKQATGTQFSLNVVLTDKLFSHRFAPRTGTN